MRSGSRDIFLERLRVLNNALSEAILIDLPPTNVDHNERARILRNGLAIIAFNTLEDFLKNRVAEVFSHISNCGIGFTVLPDKIQDAALLHSLKGIHAVSNRMRKASLDYKLFIQQEGQKLASTATATLDLSAFGFGWEKSNLDYSDVEAFLKTFQVGAATTNIHMLSNAIGCTILSPKDFFQNAADRRHAAAHDPTAAASHSDLEDYAITVKALALSFDMLISCAAQKIIASDATYLSGRSVAASDVSLRFIRKIGNKFHEMSQTNSRPIGTYNLEADALAALRGRRNYRSEMIVVLDYPSKVYKWYTSF